MKIIFTFFSSIFTIVAFSQVQGLIQSSEGKSTIPIRGTAVGLDIGKAELSFGYNNLNRQSESKALRVIFGTSVKVKNEEGIGNLFSGGNIVPSGGAQGFLGITWSNAFNNAQLSELEKRKNLIKKFDKLESNLRDRFNKDFTSAIASLVKSIPDAAERINVKNTLTDAIIKGKEETFYDQIKSLTSTNSEAKLVYQTITVFAEIRKKKYETLKKVHIQQLKELHQEYRNTSFQRFTLFGFGGISAISFKQFTGVDSTDLRNSLKNVDERGGNIGLGINYQWRNIWTGITYGYEKTNNFSLLKKKDYVLRNTVSLNPLTLIEEAKVTGYSGVFGDVEINNLNADLVIRVNLDKEYKNFLLINPYIRATMFTRNEKLMPNVLNIGTGLYFFPNSAKFFGGLYFELPDVNNNVEKMKPSDQQNLRAPFKKLSFGVITRFTLSSITGW